jgi:hypothetical protein
MGGSYRPETATVGLNASDDLRHDRTLNIS